MLTSEMKVLSVVSLGIFSSTALHGQLTDFHRPQEMNSSEIFMPNLAVFSSWASDPFTQLSATHLSESVPQVPWLVNSYLLITYHKPAVSVFFIS